MDFLFDAVGAIIRAPFIIVGWLIIGAVAGDLARRITNSPDQGCLSDWLLGVVGAFVGGFIASLAGANAAGSGLGGFIMNLVVATFGAVVLIVVRRALTGQSGAAADD